MGYLILVRHGESRWNKENKFSGWVDIPLNQNGVNEAMKVAKQLKKYNIDAAFTSKLTRAQETLLIILAEQDRTGIFLHNNEKKQAWFSNVDGAWEDRDLPIYSSINLNERYYGDLQGIDKSEARKKYGEKKVLKWRRSYHFAPPNGESLQDVYRRVVPYFRKKVWPLLKQDKDVIISAHGNSLRAVIKYIEKISDENVAYLELPNGKAFIFEMVDGKLVNKNPGYNFDRPLYWQAKRNYSES